MSTEPTDVVKIWYDPEGDFLEVEFARRAGYFRETEHEHVMARVDTQGNVIGFSILGVSLLSDKPLDLELSR